METNEGAIFSEDRKYRYVLWRIWDRSKPMVMFIGLNPSTANESTDDPTIRKVKAIAKFNGYGGVYMMNLFALISTDPKALETCENPIANNDWHMGDIAGEVKDIVFSWGNFKQVRGRDSWAKRIFPNSKCLKVNANGSPKHPLYCKNETTLIPY